MRLEELNGLGPKKANLFRNRGVMDALDLLKVFPREYEDRRTVTSIEDVKEGQKVLIHGMVTNKRLTGKPWGRNKLLRVQLSDDTGALELVFFHANYIGNAFTEGEDYYCYGKVTYGQGKRQMIHPDFFKDNDDAELSIMPIYTLPQGISQRDMRKFVKEVLSSDEFISQMKSDYIPRNFQTKYELCALEDALRDIHFPRNFEDVDRANRRFLYEEMLLMHLGLEMMEEPLENGVVIDDASASVVDEKDNALDKYIGSLPFKLTDAQLRTIEDIKNDMAGHAPMNRLVQGDVGSGKTAVAQVALFKAAKAGYQGAYMMPTEILARQQFEALRDDFTPWGIEVGYLVGGMTKKEKNAVKVKLISGDVDVIIGTHALIQEDVEFNNIGLVITDEQHRFGVRQRAALKNKGKNPNCLVMSATPIPRTLAMILFGDMDISIIDELPEGKLPIETKTVTGNSRNKAYDFVAEEIVNGRQVYVVTPLIDESEAMEGVRSATEVYEELRDRYKGAKNAKGRDVSVALLHGDMKPREKEQIMAGFASGDVDIMVSTVVIEVGINVPNATVMVIENAERFGLSQMHQLRGRVGRGKEQSYCILVIGNKSDTALERAKILTESSDGFNIAERDLELRGPGEVFGDRQHGIASEHLKMLISNMDVFEKVKDDAKEILSKHPGLADEESFALKQEVDKLFETDTGMTL